MSLPLFDYRTDPFIIKGFQGLDAHGFTVVQHESSLSGDAWFEGSNLEDVYLPEVEKLVKDLTGCKSVVCDNAAFRRKPARKQADPEYYVKRNDPESMDNLIKQGKMTVDGVFSKSFRLPRTYQSAGPAGLMRETRKSPYSRDYSFQPYLVPGLRVSPACSRHIQTVPRAATALRIGLSFELGRR